MSITVVMCTRKAGDGTAFMESLRENVGIAPMPFRDFRNNEDLFLQEMTGMTSMGQGYNLGTSQLRENCPDDVVIFTHSDVTVWAGKTLWDQMLAVVRKSETGFVGVAGSMGSLPESGAWWYNSDGLRGAVAHEVKGQYYTSAYGPFGEATIMDGVFLACKVSVLNAIGPWPEDLGWHFYDVWATEQAVKKGCKNFVVPFPLLHRSIGLPRESWRLSCGIYRMKYQTSF